MSDGIRPAADLGVTSAHSAVGGHRGRDRRAGASRVPKRPAAPVHALTGDGDLLCGAQLDNKLLWPGWSFDDISADDRCAACHLLVT